MARNAIWVPPQKAKRLRVMDKDIFAQGGNCIGRMHCRYTAELSPAVRRYQLVMPSMHLLVIIRESG